MIEKENGQEKQHMGVRCFLVLVLIAVVAVNIKSIFSDFGIDLEYAIITSYRNLKGDEMFLQMREPHQTSAFLCTALMWLYLRIVGSSNGLVIYLQVSGVLIHFAVAFLLYKALCRRMDRTLAALMSLCFGAVRAKDFVFPEFSNMQLWFSVLLFLCLLRYLERQEKKLWLVLAGICLCLTVLSYPSCVILLPIVWWVLCRYSKKRWQDCLLVGGTCGGCGAAYVLYFVEKLGFRDFLESITEIVAGDVTHTQGYGYYMYFRFLVAGLKWFGLCLLAAGLAALAGYGICRLRKKDGHPLRMFFTLFVLILLGTDIYKVIVESDRFTYIILWVFVMGISAFGWKYCSFGERKMLTVGMAISLGCFVSTMLLTNLDIMSIVKYMILGLVLSFLPFSRLLEKLYPHRVRLFSWWILLLFGFLLIFRRGFIVKTMDGMANNLLDIPVFVKIQEGPAKGIISDYMGAYGANTQVREWQEYIKEGDRVFIVGTDSVSNLAYMYGDVEICTPSSISTPTYDESLLEYWEKYPEKKPNVIVVQYNEEGLKVQADSWMEEWLAQVLAECEYDQGEFWRYYRLE